LDILMKQKFNIVFTFFIIYPLSAQSLDRNITLEKKSLMILPSELEDEEELAEKMLSIISSQAISIGRFEVIDRTIIKNILSEQEFQLSGIVNNNQILEIGELAAAEEALILDIVHFGQKGVPKPEKEENDDNDDDQTLFKWLIKTIVKETINNTLKNDSSKIKLQLENNIHTELKGNVKLVNIVTGIAEHSFEFNASYTGGNRDLSLSNALNQVSTQIRIKLKDLYMITSEIIEKNGSYVNIFSGENLGLKKGAIFEIASKNKSKTYKGKTIALPGKSRGLVRLTDIGPNASRAKIVRKWRKIKPGHKAYELKDPPETIDATFNYLKGKKYEFSVKGWFQSFSYFSASLNGYIGVVRDSREELDGYLGMGTNLDYTIFSTFGTRGSASFKFPLLFALKRDDAKHTTSSLFLDPSVDANLSIQINKNRDVVFSISYIFTNIHGRWQWQKDTGKKDNEGKNITDTEDAVWLENFGPEPIINHQGLNFSISLRTFRF